jgi:hypothetical protein
MVILWYILEWGMIVKDLLKIDPRKTIKPFDCKACTIFWSAMATHVGAAIYLNTFNPILILSFCISMVLGGIILKLYGKYFY